MTLSSTLCRVLFTTLGGVKQSLLDAAEQIGRLETAATAVCEANNSRLSQSIPATSQRPIFTFDATQLLQMTTALTRSSRYRHHRHHLLPSQLPAKLSSVQFSR
ncbi:hypothetical protein FRC03_001669 [Tulasnella sp. 419]|nr:hypothetical protein FRC03_001669 [Tulasnella sp. 419]